jgi:hypothetical protein
VKKQKDTGVWGGNLLGVTPNKAAGIKDVGTIHQYLRIAELRWSRESRPHRLGSRLLLRLLSRDPDPKLLFEFVKYSAAEAGVEPRVRQVIREAAAAALAASGFGDDPRVRGAAHAVANQISTFSVALLAHLPAVQRERAGLIERLGAYLGQPTAKRVFGIVCGKKVLKQSFVLLGDPLRVTASGQTDDVPFALYWLELLARLGILRHSTSTPKFWARLAKDCDADGVWHPKNLRSLPKRVLPWSYHSFPLEGDAKSIESRQSDVTFRMALIARLAGWEITTT